MRGFTRTRRSRNNTDQWCRWSLPKSAEIPEPPASPFLRFNQRMPPQRAIFHRSGPFGVGGVATIGQARVVSCAGNAQCRFSHFLDR